MANARNRTEAAEVKRATSEAADKAEESRVAAARADQKAAGAEGNSDQEDVARFENEGGAPEADTLSREELSERVRKDSEAAGKDAPYSPERDVTTATHEDPDKTPPEGSTADRADVPKVKEPLQARQEEAEEARNREQATSSETPAGDPSPHPMAHATANVVDEPGRAHTLSYDEDEGRAVSLGERLTRLKETEQLEIRPATHPGISSDDPQHGYDVELELRAQWPGIQLGDDKDAVPGPLHQDSPDKE